jgi:polysaccharide export outer membrane protein
VIRVIAALGILALLAGGCGGTKYEPTRDATGGEPEIKIPERPPYRLAIGDQVNIRFFYYPQYSVLTNVRPDGFITIPLMGEVRAEGMKPLELEMAIRERYTEVLAEPEVSVIVVDYAEQQIFVFGEVRSPGSIPFMGSMTIVDAIGHAGGFQVTAQMESVILMRRDTSGRYTGRKVDLEAMLESEEGENLYLFPRDVVYVPMSTIAKVDLFVEQFFRQLTPVWQWYIHGREAVDPEGKYLIGG